MAFIIDFILLTFGISIGHCMRPSILFWRNCQLFFVKNKADAYETMMVKSGGRICAMARHQNHMLVCYTILNASPSALKTQMVR